MADPTADTAAIFNVRTNRQREVERNDPTIPDIDRAYYVFKNNMNAA